MTGQHAAASMVACKWKNIRQWTHESYSRRLQW